MKNILLVYSRIRIKIINYYFDEIFKLLRKKKYKVLRNRFHPDLKIVIVFQSFHFFDKLVNILNDFDKKLTIIYISTPQTNAKNNTEVIQKNYNIIKKLLEKHDVHIVDYSYINLEYYKILYQNTNASFNILQYKCDIIEDKLYEKDIDIAIYNRKNYYNNNIVDNFKQINPENMKGLWKNNRLDFIKRCKIFINLHAEADYNICETFRINELVAYRCIIVSQRCMKEELVTFKDYIFFVDDNDIENKCLEILNDYDNIYKKLFLKTKHKIFTPIYNQWKKIDTLFNEK